MAIDRTSKLTYAELHESQRRAIAVGFLIRLVKKVPYRIHTVLTGVRPAPNGIQFTNRVDERASRGRRKRGGDEPDVLPALRGGWRRLCGGTTTSATRSSAST